MADDDCRGLSLGTVLAVQGANRRTFLVGQVLAGHLCLGSILNEEIKTFRFALIHTDPIRAVPGSIQVGRYSSRYSLFIAAGIGQGVRYYQAMELIRRSTRLGFGVLFNEASRR